ncbi:MAG: YjbQ family protein [Bacteroidetes bacterium]|nr:YjbQ family protein [Bacteroidota bacterium]
MDVITEHIKVSTKGNSDVIDITGKVEELLHQHKLTEGNATVFVVGSTASISTTEYEPGLRRDIPEMLERLAPSNTRYHHDDTWGDGNGHAHVRASFLGPSIVVPFSSGKLLLGTWQQIILIDFDTRARHRDIVVQFIGK